MRIPLVVASALGLILGGCSNTTTTANSTPKITNSDLEQAVKSKLSSDPKTEDSKLDVSAEADKNQVTLSGTVYSESARTSAVELAKAAEPGITVVDKIEVKPGEIPKTAYNRDMAKDEREKAKTAGDRIGTSVDDAWIHTKISAKLAADSATPARKINIDVVNGMVTLRGNVDNAKAKQEAGKVAKDTDGVKHVNNLLRITAG